MGPEVDGETRGDRRGSAERVCDIGGPRSSSSLSFLFSALLIWDAVPPFQHVILPGVAWLLFLHLPPHVAPPAYSNA
jgi:hypothetical protein